MENFDTQLLLGKAFSVVRKIILGHANINCFFAWFMYALLNKHSLHLTRCTFWGKSDREASSEQLKYLRNKAVFVTMFNHLQLLKSKCTLWIIKLGLMRQVFTVSFYIYFRDLTENRLSSVPVVGLGGLTHLKLRGNTELYEAFSPENFPNMR